MRRRPLDLYRDGFWDWYYKSYPCPDTDESVLPFLELPSPQKPSEQGWLRKARSALLLSTGTVADNLKVSRAAYSKLESSEEKGTISLNSLRAAAEAMDCELVYAIRPKKRVRFSAMIWEKLWKVSANHAWVQNKPDILKARSLGGIASMKMQSPRERMKFGWSKRRQLPRNEK